MSKVIPILLVIGLHLSSGLFAKTIDTFYGPIEVDEPLLLELIESPAFQRLKKIHQYGVSYYTTHREEFSRYDHCLGVFTVLRKQQVSLKEQVAGLLHDVSHTAFSHVGDWIFNKEHQEEDYQGTIHERFLEESGLGAILNKYGMTSKEIVPLEEAFPALENSVPNLCADRIDYNIQGAYYQGFITYEEAQKCLESLSFVNGVWFSDDIELMKKLVCFSLFMTEDCWGSATNHLSSRWLADAILRAIEIGELSYDDIHFGTDDEVWNLLMKHNDPFIQKRMEMVIHAKALYFLAGPEDADLIVKAKLRGIDPWVISEEGELVRLGTVDGALRDEYNRVKERMAAGWAIKFLGFYP